MWVVWAVLILLIIIGVVFFAFNNLTQVVDVNLRPLFQDRENVLLLTVVFWSFVSGALMSTFLFITSYIRQSVNLRSSKRKVKALEGELAILRNRPIEESAELLRGADKKNQPDKPTFEKE